jgi:hypothetical protein
VGLASCGWRGGRDRGGRGGPAPVAQAGRRKGRRRRDRVARRQRHAARLDRVEQLALALTDAEQVSEGDALQDDRVHPGHAAVDLPVLVADVDVDSHDVADVDAD